MLRRLLHYARRHRRRFALASSLSVLKKIFDLAPGDAILFNFRTAHGSTAAEVGARRRAFVTRWLGADMTYCERPGETSPPYDNHGMQDGERMREDWVPVLWRKG